MEERDGRADGAAPEARLEALLEAAADAIVFVDREGRITFANQAAERVLGLRPSEVEERTYDAPEWRITAVDGSPFPSEDLPFRRVLKSGAAVMGVEHAIEHPDGRRIIVSINGAPLRAPDGSIEGMVATLRDTTQRRLAEERLRESERRFRTAMHDSALGMGLLDLDGAWLEVNQALCASIGYDEAALLGRRFAEVTHPEDLPTERRFLTEALDGARSSFRMEKRCVDPGGAIVWLDLTTSLVRDERGAPAYFIVQALDIGDRKWMEAALLESEVRSRRLAEASFEGIAIHDGDVVLDANTALSRTFGYPEPDVPGMPILSLFHLDSHAEVSRRVAAGDPGPYEAVGVRRDGSDFPVEILGAPIPYDGRVARVAAIRDISERRRMEAELREAHKLEAVGRLAGGIAHDFNNILTVVTGHVSLLREELADRPELLGDLDAVADGAERAAGLTAQLLAFSRRQVLKPTSVDLNDVVRQTARLLERLLGSGVRLVTVLADGLEPLHADRSQLEQIVMNLVLNARDAVLPRGGTITVTTRAVRFDDRTAREHAARRTGDFVVLEVRDDGQGMEQGLLGRIFEPFFTTKEVGQGSGLGLSVVRGVAEQSGGWVEVDSTPGAGSTFRLFLPPAEQAAPTNPAGDAASSAASTTVLVVEDEEAVRTLVCRTLERSGYRVIGAGDAEQALRLAATHVLDAVISDVVMPGTNGFDLARQLAGSWPELPVILMSGYARDEVVRRGIAEHRVPFLTKPFAPPALLELVSDVLRQARSGEWRPWAEPIAS